MQLADYAMIANSVPQDVKLQSPDEIQANKLKLSSMALGNDQQAMQNQKMREQLDDPLVEHAKKMAQLDADNKFAINALGAAINEPDPVKKNQIWQSGLKYLQDNGHDISTLPQQYDDNEAKRMLTQSIGIQKQIENHINEIKAARTGSAGHPEYILVTDKDGKQYKLNKNANEDAAPVNFGGQQIVSPVYNPSSQAGITTAKAQAQADVDLATKPVIAAETDKAKNAVEKQVTQQAAAGSLDDANTIYKSIDPNSLDKIYGRGENYYLDFMRSQEGIDAKRNIGQIESMLELAQSNQLKGQGAITDSERKILADSVSVLKNYDVSPKLARDSLDRAMNILYRKAGKQFVAPAAGTANTQAEKLHPDDIQALIDAARAK